MGKYDWRDLLTQWNAEMLAKQESRQWLPADKVAAGWLGNPGATETQLAQAEARLGVALPPSYREFLSFTNGWHFAGLSIEQVWSTDDIDWLAVRHQRDVIDAWLFGIGEVVPVPDEEYFVYGDEQSVLSLRSEYLQTTLEVSEIGDASLYLLNPRIMRDGEWEAWYFDAKLAGAERHRSFWDLMLAEHAKFLDVQRRG